MVEPNWQKKTKLAKNSQVPVLAGLEFESLATRSASEPRRCCSDRSGSPGWSCAAAGSRGPSPGAGSEERRTSWRKRARRKRTSGESQCSGKVLPGRRTWNEGFQLPTTFNTLPVWYIRRTENIDNLIASKCTSKMEWH